MIPVNNNNRQSSIFDAKCSDCQIYKACGGGVSSPCGCFQTGSKRYDCINCKHICQDRHIDEEGIEDTFAIHNFTGRNLDDVQFKQDTLDAPLPLIIPSKTHKLPDGFQFEVKWAAIEIDKILQNFNDPSVRSDDTQWIISVRKAARVLKNTKLLAVLNGNDRDLERFWGSNRHNVYKTMAMSNFSAVTGPTFSVYEATEDNRNILESHRVTMLRRHHRVIQELAEGDLTPVPNIYCRNEHDIKKWIEWLSNNESIKYISRDLTCSRQMNAEYKGYVNQLIEIVRGTGRAFHIIFPGASQSKASRLMEQFSEIGCTCSFVISDPIITGSYGYELVFRGTELPLKEKNTDSDWSQLAIKNVSILNKHLLAVAAQIPLYKDSLMEFSNSPVLHLTEAKHSLNEESQKGKYKKHHM